MIRTLKYSALAFATAVGCAAHAATPVTILRIACHRAAAGRDHYRRQDGPGRLVYRGQRPDLRQHAELLPRPRRRRADARIGDQFRGVDPDRELERPLQRRRQRRPRRHDQLQRDGARRAAGLCRGEHRHRPRAHRAANVALEPRAHHRLQLSRIPSHDAVREVLDRRALRLGPGLLVLHRLLHRRKAGTDGGTALPRRLRRHRRRRPGELLDDADGVRSLGRRR